MRLACITIPHFRIALERARAPDLGRQAIAIGEALSGDRTIIDCSPEAAALGIRRGMPLRDARTMAPDLVVLPPDPVFYRRAADALLDAIEDTEPRVEAADDAEGTVFAAIDQAAEAEAQQRAGERLLRAVRAGAGVEASVGIGEGKFIAWTAATVSAPGELTFVPAGSEQAFVGPLGTSFLPVSYATQRKLALYALSTIGEVAAVEIGALQAQFGREGRQLWELARGIDPAPFVPRARSEPVSGTLAMPSATVNSAALLIAAQQLIGRLTTRPAMRHRLVRQLRLRLALLGGGSWEHTLTLREPTADEEALLFVLKKLIEPLQLTAPVEEMGLEFIDLSGETGKQRSLLFAEQPRRRAQLIATLHQLKARFGGEPQVARVVEVEPWSRIPERRYALIDYDL
ncbi:MAG: DNA polymerase Y family protein [Dehalococcoidia bacterium]|nr:DNA polymerase Y family protein [Dehalococcoidia bacterium]